MSRDLACAVMAVSISMLSRGLLAPAALIEDVELQPLAAQAARVADALDYLGEPLSAADAAALREAASAEPAAGVKRIQEVLDPHCLLQVDINPESRVKLAPGVAKPILVEQGWRVFLVKIHNEAGVTAEPQATSPNAQEVYTPSTVMDPDPPHKLTDADLRHRWMDIACFNDRPLTKTLSGLKLEYRIVQIYSRDAGSREATIGINVGQGTQDIGFRNDVAILFTAQPSRKLTLKVLDEDGSPTTACFTIRDKQQRVYPAQSKRLAPDFFFHAQVYRADGETVTLPAGEYDIEFTRGPEYLVQHQAVKIEPGKEPAAAEFRLKRWVHLKKEGWYSGDHHVHGAGCAHYVDPRQGVTPADMMRHIHGEDLNVGCVLSWGPCWYHQKTFFEGRVSPLSKPNYLMRYDVEVSGFPSDYCGHLCLIGLKEDDYPGAQRLEGWPSWDLPILKWGKSQGGVVGFSHSGWGLFTKDTRVPNYEIPPYDGIGANEYIVDVTHDAVDFISSVDTPWPFELNIWYHTNNAGFRTKLSGETDFPCIYGERVGLGRVYAKVDGELTFDKWLASMKAGRSYVSEGHAHLLDFRVEDREVGVEGSELRIASPRTVKAHVKAIALLPEKIDPTIAERPIQEKPYWSIERARRKETRTVRVELVVNGKLVSRPDIVADGRPHDLEFEVPIAQSSWIAARIFASAHTNPIYVVVGDKPIRASRKSVQWCLDGVEQCWKSKSGNRLRKEERADCEAAYNHAREVYRARLAECETE